MLLQVATHPRLSVMFEGQPVNVSPAVHRRRPCRLCSRGGGVGGVSMGISSMSGSPSSSLGGGGVCGQGQHLGMHGRRGVLKLSA